MVLVCQTKPVKCCKLQNIVRNAIIPMDISLSVDGDTLILRQLFTPGFATKAVDCPIVAVKAAPQDSAAILIHKLLGE